jgi:acetoin utilization protein AcuB
MFVTKAMTRKVVTVRPEDNILDTRELMKAHKFHHIPVVEEGNKLVGIISDRDVRSAMPSTLYYESGSERERAKLEKFKVRDVMTKNVITLSLRDTIQDALLLLLKYDFGALPVVDGDGRLVGILAVHNLLRALVSVLGIGQPGSLLCLLVEDKLGETKKIVDIIFEEKIPIGSILVARHWEPGKRAVFPYLMSINVGALKRRFQEKGYTILDPEEWYLEDVERTKEEKVP